MCLLAVRVCLLFACFCLSSISFVAMVAYCRLRCVVFVAVLGACLCYVKRCCLCACVIFLFLCDLMF